MAIHLAGFADWNASLPERPQLRSFGVDLEQAGVQDWHGGSRRLKIDGSQ